jgi:hypothetical protein
MSWQGAAVLVIEALAVAYLVYKLWPSRRPRVFEKPDVPADRLVRTKKRSNDAGP